MFCPQCSQELPFPAMRYCYDCGLPLLKAGQALSQAEGNSSTDTVARRRGWFNLLSGSGLSVLGYFSGAFSLILAGRLLPQGVSVTLLASLGYLMAVCAACLGPALFLLGLAQIIYAAARTTRPLPALPAASPVTPQSPLALSSKPGISVIVWQRSINTKGLSGPVSVCAYTTKLL